MEFRTWQEKSKSLFRCFKSSTAETGGKARRGNWGPDWLCTHPRDRANDQDDKFPCKFHVCLLSTNLSGLGYEIQSCPNRKHTPERNDGRLRPCTVLGNALNSLPQTEQEAVVWSGLTCSLVTEHAHQSWALPSRSGLPKLTHLLWAQF